MADEPATGSDGGFITDEMANRWIDQAFAKVLDMLVDADPDWGVTEALIYTTQGVLEYALPPLVYQIRGVDMFESQIGDPDDDIESNVALARDARYVPIESFNFLDRGRGLLIYPPPRWPHFPEVVRYRVIRRGTTGTDARIRFEPDPGTRTYRLWYIPSAEILDDTAADDANVLDGVNGWEEYVIADAAEKMMIRARLDPSGAVRQKAEAEKRIRSMAPKRDRGRPVQVADTRHRRFFP